MLAANEHTTIDALRTAYNRLTWLKWLFPKRISAALATLPLIEVASGCSTTGYTRSDAASILTAFSKTNRATLWFSTLLFHCLRVFKASELFKMYQRNPSAFDQHADSETMEGEAAAAFGVTVTGTPGRISALPADLFGSKASGVGAFLSRSEMASFASTSKGVFELCELVRKKGKLKELPQLLHAVVQGRQKRVEAILLRLPELLTERGDVTDYSGRTFHHVSPWECMLWSLDTRYMGQMMLHCIPEGAKGDAIRRECVAQYEAMQAGGRDVVKMDRNPRDMPLGELQAFLARLGADNKDVLLYHWDAVSDTDCFYYYNDNTVSVFEYHFMAEENAAFMALFRRMDMNSAKKSNDAEHALITAAAGITLSRKGICYEQPAAYKPLVKLGGTADPGDIDFGDISVLFDAPDAVLFWNNQFYYADKEECSVTKIEPTHVEPREVTASFALKTALTSMQNNQSRYPNTWKEHQLINALFRKHPAFKPTHHRESHYDFGLIEVLQQYSNCVEYVPGFEGMTREQLDASWRNSVARAQRGAPAHVLQHYCDPHTAFFEGVSGPDFLASDFEREDWINNEYFTHKTHLFQGAAFNDGFGFRFGLIRGSIDGGAVMQSEMPGVTAYLSWDIAALSRLCQIRTADARLLQDSLNNLMPVSVVSANTMKM